MARFVFVGIGVLALATSAFAQVPNPAAPPGPFDKAVAAAPRQMREGAMVIKWKADGTYDTLRPGTNRLVCYDQSGEASEQPFSSQCTSVGNMDRAQQNMKFESEPDRAKRQAALDAAEKDGSRAKPEFGSVWYHVMGADPEHTRTHMTIAVPFNDAEAMERRIERLVEEGRAPACVIMEPAMMNLGIVLPEPGYLEAVREITRKHGVLLIFDEVKTGLCIAAGGAVERFGVVADLRSEEHTSELQSQ